MHEKRSAERKQVDTVMPVSDINTGSDLGHVVNVTVGGVMLMTPRPIAPNQVYQLRIGLPEEMEGSRALVVGVESLWCKPADGMDRYWAGFQLIDISARNMLLLERLIAAC